MGGKEGYILSYLKALSETSLEIQGRRVTWKFDCHCGTLLSGVKNGTEEEVESAIHGI